MEGYGNENPGAFQPTRPLRGATACAYFNRPKAPKFQPTRPLRGATDIWLVGDYSDKFQPTRPLRGATLACVEVGHACRFQPTRPLRGATVATGWRAGSRRKISTHAPLAGRDHFEYLPVFNFVVFQPTRPLRGATGGSVAANLVISFQPTRPLRGATQVDLGCMLR